MTTITRKPGNKRVEALLAQAVGHLQRNQADEGEALLQQGLALDPDDAESLKVLGALRASQGRFSEAEEHYRHALSVNPDQPQLLNALGQVLSHRNRNTDAVEVFRQSIALKPNYAEGHLNLGLALSMSAAIWRPRKVSATRFAFSPI